MDSDGEKITISWDEIEEVQETPPPPSAVPPPSQHESSWGKVHAAPGAPSASHAEHGSLFMKSWFYLGLASLAGAFFAWVLCEPAFEDEMAEGWGNVMLFPLMAILMCVSLGTIEGIVERSWRRAFLRGLSAAGLGLILGFLFNILSNIVFGLLLALVGSMSDVTVENPLLWISRSIAWAAFGMAGGLIYGIVSKSGRKISYGMLGGALGAAVGGLCFDPICLLAGGAEASRAVGMSILGASTGIAIGLVESALKDRWLYVASGPLAGKQFILYHAQTTIGKQQSCSIYLFKDPSILDQHAVIQHRGTRTFITAYGPVAVSGQHIRANTERVLANGESIQIGQYVFQYSEKAKTGKSV
jgi:hypothetical protein